MPKTLMQFRDLKRLKISRSGDCIVTQIESVQRAQNCDAWGQRACQVVDLKLNLPQLTREVRHDPRKGKVGNP